MIKNIEHKIKLTFIIALVCIVGSVVTVLATISYSYAMIAKERDTLYVLDNGMPLMVQRSNAQLNRHIEYRATINTFHKLFYTLPPDDDYIQQNIDQSMYLIDNTGILEHNNLKEIGYYNRIMSSSSVLSIKTDSIVIDMVGRDFTFYGRQRIDRPSKVTFRTLVTKGSLSDVQRTVNNPFGAIITNWRAIENRDISESDNKLFQ